MALIDSAPSGQRPLRAPHHSPPGTWTRELVLQALVGWSREAGGAPRSYEWSPSTGRALGYLPAGPSLWERRYPRYPSSQTVYRHFASWSEALRAAGLPAPEPVVHELPRLERIEGARRLHRQGHSFAAIADMLGVSRRTAREYVHAGDCPRCGQPKASRRSRSCLPCAQRVPSRPSAFDRDTLLARLREWHERFGVSPGWSDWRPASGGEPNRFERDWPHWPSSGSVTVAFRSWNAALAAAGLPRHSKHWTEEEILIALRRWAALYGKPPTAAQLEREPDRGEWPSPGQVAARYGSFTAALKAAGLAPHRQPWTEPEVRAALLALERELGRQPTLRDLDLADRARYPAAATVIRRYDGWRNALEQLGWTPPWTRVTREDARRALRAFHTQHGRAPTAPEWQRSRRRPALRSIVKLYGSWAEGIRQELGINHPPRRPRPAAKP